MKKILPPLLLVAIILFVHNSWLSFNYFYSGDYYPFTYITQLSHVKMSTWDSSITFGNQNLIFWRYPNLFLQGLFGYLGYDSNVSEKFIVFWPSIIGGVLGFYLLSLKFGLKPWGSFISSLVFNLNTYYLSSRDHLYIYSSEVASLWSLIFLTEYLKSKKNTNLFLTILFVFISGAFDMRGVYLGLFLIGIYLFVISLGKSFKQYLKYFLLYFFIICIFILMNAYWIIPQFFSKVLTENEVLNRNLFGNEFLSVPHLLTLHHPFWTGSKPAWFHTQKVPLLFWFVPIIAFLAFRFTKNRNLALFAGLILFFGFFLGKQVSAPFGFIYRFLFDYFPLFSAFREASKFFFFTAVGYALLFGIYIDHIVQRYKKSKSIAFMYFIIFLLGFIPAVVQPSFAHAVRNIYKIDVPVEFPDSYRSVQQVFKTISNLERTLIIPYTPVWFDYSNDRPAIGMNKLLLLLGDSFDLMEKTKPLELNSFTLLKVFHSENFYNYLRNAAISHILLPPEDDTLIGNLYKKYKLNRSDIKRELIKKPYLKLIISNKDFTVFEVQKSCSRLYGKVYEGSEYDCDIIPYTRLNASEYLIRPINSNNLQKIFFSETHNPNWILMDKKIGYWEKFFPWMIKGISPIKTEYGFQVYDSRNTKFSQEFTLIYAPQLYVFHGVVIAVILTAVILCVVSNKQIRGKNINKKL